MDNLGEMVDFLWEQCVCKEKDAYKNLNNLIGEGKLNDFVYDKEKIERYQPMIQLIASSLIENSSDVEYYNLAYTADGERWTKYYFEVEKAVSLLNVSGMLEFCTPSKNRDAAESRNPMVRIKR